MKIVLLKIQTPHANEYFKKLKKVKIFLVFAYFLLILSYMLEITEEIYLEILYEHFND